MAETLLRNSQVEYDTTGNIPYADETDRGAVIKATDQEVLDGVENTKYVTPAQVGTNFITTLTINNAGPGTVSTAVPVGTKIAIVYTQDSGLNGVYMSGILVDGVILNIVTNEGSTGEARITWNGNNFDYFLGGASSISVKVYCFKSL